MSAALLRVERRHEPDFDRQVRAILALLKSKDRPRDEAAPRNPSEVRRVRDVSLRT
jgi:hypothetical protein